MKKWTEAQPRSANIADYEEFNLAYDPLKATFNGGLGRAEIPADAISDQHIAQEAMLQVTVDWHSLTKCQFPNTGDPFQDTQTGSAVCFRATSYDVYTGGWINILTKNYTNLKAGYMHIEFKSHIYIQSYYAGNQTIAGPTVVAGNPKALRVRLLWNGTPIAESAFYTQPVQSVRVVADLPSPGGPGELTIQAICNARSNVENSPATEQPYPLFHFFGMNTLLVGRWR